MLRLDEVKEGEGVQSANNLECQETGRLCLLCFPILFSESENTQSQSSSVIGSLNPTTSQRLYQGCGGIADSVKHKVLSLDF